MYWRGFLLLMPLMKFGVFSFSLNSWHFAPNPQTEVWMDNKNLWSPCIKHVNSTTSYTIYENLQKETNMEIGKKIIHEKTTFIPGIQLVCVFGECIDLVKFAFSSRNKDTNYYTTDAKNLLTTSHYIVACSKRSKNVYKVIKENKGHLHPLEIGHCNVVNWLRRSHWRRTIDMTNK